MGLGLTAFVPIIIYSCTPLVILATLFYRVEVGLIFLLPLIPIEGIRVKLDTFTQGQNIVDFVLLAVLLKTIAGNGIKRALDTPVLKPIAVLTLLSFGSLFIGASGNPISFKNSYFIFWKNFMMMPLAFVLIFCNIEEKNHIKLFIVIMVFSMLANDFNFYTTFKWFNTEHFENKMRISTLRYLGPNEMAALVAQCTALLVGIVLFVKEKKWVLFYISCILGNLYVVMYSFSRSGYLSILGGFCVAGVFGKRIILFLIVLLLLTSKFLLPNAVNERIGMTINNEAPKGVSELDHASAARIGVWRNGLKKFSSNPLGVGFERFSSLGLGEFQARDAHNMYLKMAVELGLQGLIVYLYLYYLAFKRGWLLFRSRKDDFYKGLGLGFMCATITSMVGNFFDQHWGWFTVTCYWWIYWAFVEKALIIQKARESGDSMESNGRSFSTI